MIPTQNVLSSINIRTAYEQAVAWYLGRVGAVDDAHWNDTGLGVWSVRELVAHGARSITLVTDGLNAASGADGDAPPLVGSGPLGYWRAVFGRLDTDEFATLSGQVAERGRQDAALLGDDPVQTVWTMAEATLNRLADTVDDALIATRFGQLTLVDYLPSRVVELVTHGLDLCRATGQPLDPPELAAAVSVAMLTGFGDPARVVLALTGREPYAVLA